MMKQALFGICPSSKNNLIFVTAYEPNYRIKLSKVKVPNNNGELIYVDEIAAFEKSLTVYDLSQNL